MTGPLFLIGGHEDREGGRTILRAFADALGSGPIALVTAPSAAPERYLPMYEDAFEPLGVEVVELRLEDRASADLGSDLGVLRRCGGIFISGGDQLRGVATLRDSVAAEVIRQRWLDGCPVAGTSAGASMLGEAMLGRGANDDSPDPSKLQVVEGLGLVHGALIDQHLSQRGRTPRLLAATALCGKLGIGVDEDTAAVVRGSELTVIGTGTVTIVEGAAADASRHPHGVSIRDLHVDVLTPEDEPVSLALG